MLLFKKSFNEISKFWKSGLSLLYRCKNELQFSLQSYHTLYESVTYLIEIKVNTSE